MSEDLEKKWTNKIAEKISDVKHERSLSEAQVDSFFDRVDNRKPKSFRWIKLAASVALLIVSGIGMYSVNNVTVESFAGNLAEATLPDDSQVRIGFNSRIKYNRLTWIFTRNVDLDGEAYFEVSKGSKFSVHSDNGTTSVLGTKFNVSSTEKGYEVRCYEGIVAVVSGKTRITIEIGQGINVHGSGESEDLRFDAILPEWLNMEAAFESVKLSSVLEELATIYGVEFENTELSDGMTFTGVFPTDDLDVALKVVLEPFSLSYKKDKKKIKLQQKGK